jgi:DNA-binding NarL/FixJ family response regulator
VIGDLNGFIPLASTEKGMHRDSHYLIVLADDHPQVRRWIKKLIEESPELKVAGEVSDGLELLDFLEKNDPHMVLLDISMPNLGGIEATRKIKENYPEIKVLILTMHNNQEYLRCALLAGADGYLLKEEADTALFPAISALRDGKTYISPPLSI